MQTPSNIMQLQVSYKPAQPTQLFWHNSQVNTLNLNVSDLLLWKDTWRYLQCSYSNTAHWAI